MQLPRYLVFDVSAGAGLRCLGPAPAAAARAGVPSHRAQQAMALEEALRRTRLLPRDADPAARRPFHFQAGAATTVDGAGHAQLRIGDPDDTASDAGTSSGVRAAEESDDEVDSFDALLCGESFARRIDALAELVGMRGARDPAAVLGEVVRVLRAVDGGKRKGAFCVCNDGRLM